MFTKIIAVYENKLNFGSFNKHKHSIKHLLPLIKIQYEYWKQFSKVKNNIQ